MPRLLWLRFSLPMLQLWSQFLDRSLTLNFVISRHGNQGEMNRASKGQLEAEFGTSRDDDVMKVILQQGTIIESESKEGKGNRNVANSGGSARD